MNKSYNGESVLIKELESPIIEKPSILIQGLPGMGLIGRIAATFLIENTKLKAKEIARVYSSFLPPVVQIENTEGIGRLARLELYAITETTPNIIILTGDFQPIEIGIIQVLGKILDYVNKFNVDTVICLGGLRTHDEKPDVAGFAYNEEDMDFLQKNGITPLKSGEISGAVGVLSALAAERGLKSFGLLGRLTLTGTDPLASKRILQIIDQLYSFDFNYEKIDAMIEEAKIRDKQLDMARDMIMRDDEDREGPGYYI